MSTVSHWDWIRHPHPPRAHTTSLPLPLSLPHHLHRNPYTISLSHRHTHKSCIYHKGLRTCTYTSLRHLSCDVTLKRLVNLKYRLERKGQRALKVHIENHPHGHPKQLQCCFLKSATVPVYDV